MKFTQKIKAFFPKVASWFKMTTEKSDELISKYAPIAVDVLQSIKKFNDSSSADAVEVSLKAYRENTNSVLRQCTRRYASGLPTASRRL